MSHEYILQLIYDNNNTGDFMDDMNKNGGGNAAAAERSNIVLITVGWISAVLSLFMYPFIFGVLGVVMGILASKQGSRAGLPLIVASMVLMGVGLFYSGVILNYMRLFLGI